MTTPNELVTAGQAEEDRIDRLRLRAFKTNNEDDRRKYFEATSKWYQDRHYRSIALHEALAAEKSAKWAEKHTDTMNDIVQMGMSRDAAEARADAAEARERMAYNAGYVDGSTGCPNKFTGAIGVSIGDELTDATEARVAVRVKPLVWTEREDHGQWYGKDLNARFHYTVLPEIQGDLNGPWVCMLNDLWRPYPDLEAAKAAAQADYEARIRAALETGAGDD